MNNVVDFSYSFGTPHRITVAMPDSSSKTLLDLEKGGCKMSWTYDDLTRMPLGALMLPTTSKHVWFRPTVDGIPFADSRWTRSEGHLPVLVNTYFNSSSSVSMKLEIVGGEEAAIVRIDITNADDQERQFQLLCGDTPWSSAYNPNWVNPNDEADVLLAGWLDRADRILVVGIGAEAYTSNPTSFTMSWDVKPGESRTAWIIRPYQAYAADSEKLRIKDWEHDFEQAKQHWRTLLAKAARIHIPDEAVEQCFLACLADIFIMREPVAQGYIAPTPGTEGYRAPNSIEPLLGCIALDQFGMHQEAEAAFRMAVEQQEDNGDWTDPKGWTHLMWAGSGFKAWTVMEHYRLTGNIEFLQEIYPRLTASTRWQEKMRASTRIDAGGKRTSTYGLMPRGMGDCGLMNDEDYYGVFYPHNFWSLFADRLTMEAAQILGKDADEKEFRRIYETAREDLVASLQLGAIQEEDYRWISGVANKTCGSRWGALNAVYPCGVLSAEDELMRGTIRYIESRMSPGGMPLNTGWLKEGMWVAATLDNVAQFHLAEGNGDASIDYLYSTLNHGTPLITWCEERGQEAGTTNCTGDRQHLWTPAAVVRLLRDSYLMEEGTTLHLARGLERSWLISGKKVGITGAPTHFGRVSYEIEYDMELSKLVGKINFPEDCKMEEAILHIRLPLNYEVISINSVSGSVEPSLISGGKLNWKAPRGEVTFEAIIAAAAS
ncbi:hypothetical protein [Paenibacillus eucommiae]|uniref:Alpha-L-rhamnosidase six-hairpin glycosidase domain-containing protein n=1 Tax=Paenibacillus eucommiae TaxID=1355755 RepID=A0ABS4J2F1_9BACL|nr:hypothetical protein [Paenibacillus eucommiae]MBP1994010.1 hypothetical protein [Paenibacillus eucommiae]